MLIYAHKEFFRDSLAKPVLFWSFFYKINLSFARFPPFQALVTLEY